MPTSLVIYSEKITKVYRNGTVALNDFDLQVPGGTVFSLLGRNGAGKTTFVRIASTQLMPTLGSLTVLGFDVVKETSRIRSRIALVPQEGKPASLNTPFEHIYHYLLARGMSNGEAKLRARRILADLELEEYANTICSQLSGGLRQKTLVAMALSSDAELLFLDEPTIGLDALTRLKIWDVVKRLTKEEGRTMLLTTHYMEEAEAVSDMVAIVDRGRVVTCGGVEEVKGSLNASMKVEVVGGEFAHGELGAYGRVVRAGGTSRVLLRDSVEKQLVGLAISRGAKATVSRVTLEDVFVAMVGQRLED